MIERNLALQIEAIEYEHWMLLETSRIMTAQWLQFDRVTANAFVEAHAIHLRNLIEFLFDKPDPLRMRAADFVAGWGPDRPELLGRALGRTAIEIAHLGVERVNRSRKPWGSEYAHAVNDYMQRWLSEATSEIKAHFKLRRELRQVLPSEDGERAYPHISGIAQSTASITEAN
jgi:hypothetical protein